MSDVSKIIDVQVKGHQVHTEYKDPVQQIKKKVVPTSLEANQRAKNARKEAHTLSADVKRDISMEIKNKLSESFDFIEESCGSGSPDFEFYDEPRMVTEGLEEGAPAYPIIGRASGVFAPIGVMSRNNRIYDNDHYDYLLENQQLVDRIAHRGMLGTIGHHDKKVDDQDLAEGKVSHIVTNLRIVEEADGSRNLYGTLEILDTPAGHLLKTYYDSGVPLFVSSRGGGNLLPVPNESYKRVDKTKYFLETFDIVKNPGFLQAKPVYEKVTEELETIEDFKVSSILHKSISEEELAIAEYEKRSAKCKAHMNEDMAKMFAELADDEKVHAAQLKEALNILNLNNPAKEIEGKIEAKNAFQPATPVGLTGYATTGTIGAGTIGESANTGVFVSTKTISTNANSGWATATDHTIPLVESNKIDTLIDSVNNLVNVISESDKKVQIKQESNETKEKSESKEAKEAPEAKEAKEKNVIDEKKSSKDTNKPEDEENEDGEDAVASSVTEKKEELTHDEKVQRIIDPHKGLDEKSIKKGYVQTNFITKDDAEKMVDAEEKATAERQAMIDKLKAGAKKNRAVKQKAEQMKLALNCSIDEKMEIEGIKKPQTLKQRGSNSTANYLNQVNKKSIENSSVSEDNLDEEAKSKKVNNMNDNNSIKLANALQAIEEADKMLEQPVQPVLATGDSVKSAQEEKPEVKEPVTMDRLELARALKAKVMNNRQVEV